MAKRAFLKTVLIVAATALFTGCQSAQQSMVSVLPAPNFAGPVVAPQRPVVAMVPHTAPPVVMTQASPVMGNVPKDWIPLAGYHRDWYYIVIHHSATPSGSMKEFDREHKEKGWDECGYDFVIGNGTGSGNGQIEVGPRWPVQKYGAHAKTPDNRYNEHGIGICLVGNFMVDHPTAAQMASLDRLVSYLMRTYKIPVTNVMGHRDTKPTECPGRNVDIAAIRRAVSPRLADADLPADSQSVPNETVAANSDSTANANTELLHSTP